MLFFLEGMILIKSSLEKKTGCLTISVIGRFDYTCHKAFKEAFGGGVVTCYEVDLSETLYLDSSALGMLLLLRDHAGGEKATVRLLSPNRTVLEVLNMANFGLLFNIVE